MWLVFKLWLVYNGLKWMKYDSIPRKRIHSNSDPQCTHNLDQLQQLSAASVCIQCFCLHSPLLNSTVLIISPCVNKCNLETRLSGRIDWSTTFHNHIHTWLQPRALYRSLWSHLTFPWKIVFLCSDPSTTFPQTCHSFHNSKQTQFNLSSRKYRKEQSFIIRK